MNYKIGGEYDRKSLCESRRFDAFAKPTDAGEFVLILATYLESAFDALNTQSDKQERIEQLEAAMQEFVDRCAKGEVLSKYTRAKFELLLAGNSVGPTDFGLVFHADGTVTKEGRPLDPASDWIMPDDGDRQT